MAIIVEHDKRKREILDKALDVFVEEGYEDATFQKISDRCGITRTTLYLYFKNKREIFVWSIKQLTEELEAALQKVIADTAVAIDERFRRMLNKILDSCVENQKLFTVILTYLLQIQKTGKDPDVRVRRRIVRLRHLLSTVYIEGMKGGIFRKLPVKDVNEILYGLIESVIFRLAILGRSKVDDLRSALMLTVDTLLVNPVY
ncbi:MAG: TetR/AcrR family transcriptional regulator [Spirochaetaceae bacterium]|jgi:AcrR family transcriptional regulator|nr:TetR/AcrR family transcriptional regulator [Spirochaetaceae bacterium]